MSGSPTPDDAVQHSCKFAFAGLLSGLWPFCTRSPTRATMRTVRETWMGEISTPSPGVFRTPGETSRPIRQWRPPHASKPGRRRRAGADPDPSAIGTRELRARRDGPTRYRRSEAGNDRCVIVLVRVPAGGVPPRCRAKRCRRFPTISPYRRERSRPAYMVYTYSNVYPGPVSETRIFRGRRGGYAASHHRERRWSH